MALELNRISDEALVFVYNGEPIGEIIQRIRTNPAGKLETVNEIYLHPKVRVYREEICEEQLLDKLDRMEGSRWKQSNAFGTGSTKDIESTERE